MALEIIQESHIDHGLSEEMLSFILNKFKDKNEFFIETFTVPGASLDNALYGPIEGDPPIDESEVYYAKRGDRPGESRMIKRPLRKTNEVTVIAGPHEGKPCVLYTAYGGKLAPREPFDKGLQGNDMVDSKEFWSKHALADGSSNAEENDKKEDNIEVEASFNKRAIDMKSELIGKLSEIGQMLSSPDNELMQLGERVLSDEDYVMFAQSLLGAASGVGAALKIVNESDTLVETISEDSIDELGALAQALDETDDPILKKQAAAIDELLMTIGADPKVQMAFKKAESDEIERLRAKYRETRGDREYKDVKAQHDKENKAQEAIKAVDAKIKRYRPLEAPLSTRYSPDMPGVSLVRIGDGVYQCSVTNKIYDFRAGYTTMKGNKIPGSDVSNQTQHLGYQAQEHMNFGTREQTLNGS